MLTTTQNITGQTTRSTVDAVELPSDHEIAARVLEIRKGWDLNERIARRDEAERRFTDLIETLTQSVAA